VKLFHLAFASASTVCFTVFGKLILLMWIDFKLEPSFATALAASKNDTRYKSGQN
jgi:hypothetical protein